LLTFRWPSIAASRTHSPTIRPNATVQKISGGFRSLEGAMDFTLIRPFFSTARKQGWNIIDALTRDPSNLAKSLRLA
jgi:hypothetical protein